MMRVGRRRSAGASARIAVPSGLPPHLRSQMRELYAVKSSRQGRGEAEALLLSICAEADATHTALLLMVDKGDIERLAGWYQRHGFEQIQATPMLMARMAT
jgi:N-acetylglutamate synthase-like GNAT family acetyltransferase